MVDRRVNRRRIPGAALLVLSLLLLSAALPRVGLAADGGLIRSVRVLPPNHLRVTLAGPLDDRTAGNFRLSEEKAPDLPMALLAVETLPDGHLLLTTGQRVDPAGRYRLEIRTPAAARDIHPAPWALLLTVVLSSALINNFVFTRYLGLCIFFGVSKKRDTSVGMGFTFIAVMVLTAMFSWAVYSFVLAPLQLRFLQVLVFIGVVAFLVQVLDTVLKKVNLALHRKFGIYLMLITTNCIILAVPLLNAAGNVGPLDALALAIGSGVGFAVALFLMSCARERLELARVPQAFQGLPIAFVLAGLFALAFMGFSGLNVLR